MDIDTFKSVCSTLIDDPELQPANGVTHCNQALTRLAAQFGFGDFDGKLANDCIDLMASDGRWRECTSEEAWMWANQGHLAVACQKEEPHGHVAVICPGEKVFSAKWQADVPQIANVGQKNGIFGENYAFREPPTHYLYQGDEPAG